VPEATGEGESGCLGCFLVNFGVDKAWELVPKYKSRYFSIDYDELVETA
jgi:hypothetical protein